MHCTLFQSWQIFDFEELGSTNSFLKQEAELDLDKIVVNTPVQTQGRGRMGRSWLSQTGLDLTFSIQMDLSPIPAQNWSLSSLVAGLALSDYLQSKSVDHQIKWPNDLASQNRKLCGILCETTQKNGKYFVIVGIGINVNSPASTYEIPHPGAISLSEITQTPWDLHQTLLEFLPFFERRFEQLLQGDIESICLAIEPRLLGMGKEVLWHPTLDHPGTRVRISGLALDGQLLAQGPEGTVCIQSGELSWKDLLD